MKKSLVLGSILLAVLSATPADAEPSRLVADEAFPKAYPDVCRQRREKEVIWRVLSFRCRNESHTAVGVFDFFPNNEGGVASVSCESELEQIPLTPVTMYGKLCMKHCVQSACRYYYVPTSEAAPAPAN